MMHKAYIVFDLDDTLYKEVDFLLSAYNYISSELEKYVGQNIYDEMKAYWTDGESTFDVLKVRFDFPLSIAELVEMYRYHKPNISLSSGADVLLSSLRKKGLCMGIITDGRSITQRNKLTALGIHDTFDQIIISEEINSEKPAKKNFQLLASEDSLAQYFYIADNPKKDFVAPNSLGWVTIALNDNGRNIHPQKWNDLEEKYLPHHRCNDFFEISDLLFSRYLS